MLAFSAPRAQSSLVVKTAASIRPGDRLILGRTASLILPRLYLANLFTAQDEEQLVALGITHVVSVMEQPPKLPKSMPQLRTLYVPVADAANANLLKYMDETTEFIKDALTENEQNRVLVHCLVGMSRSATVVCAYLLATTPMNPEEAVGFVVSRRCIVSPNAGFRRQLEKYYARLHPKPPKDEPQLSRGILHRIRLWRRAAASRKKITDDLRIPNASSEILA
ncbi:phosphatases II [Laetiporus sulphureus 93-53]|uniref:Phosphatases II n=1 Tax=Laetiporus sulphureus 93-53 TaxID=1314785 RepID=A0A165EKW0_9APHY|nr:phosphatases II [Laetiporus sulphureus 93-53]KZT07271.1 phosphatases II [Laetiporus sulphureus 93-53]